MIPLGAGPAEVAAMNQERWSKVDRYIADRLLPPDPILDAALRANAAAGLPGIDVAPAQGKFLHLLALLTRARSILEIGTLGGYSTIWLARALPPGGHLVTLEVDPNHAAVARGNLARAGLDDRVEVREGAALETLAALEREGAGPFDFVFIDADKPAYPDYLRGAVRLARPGTLIVADNVVRRGAVADPDDPDPRVRGARAFFDALAAEPRLIATALQTVGIKGHDGLALALVAGEPRPAP